jgi:hypothetical protein
MQKKEIAENKKQKETSEKTKKKQQKRGKPLLAGPTPPPGVRRDTSQTYL